MRSKIKHIFIICERLSLLAAFCLTFVGFSILTNPASALPMQEVQQSASKADQTDSTQVNVNPSDEQDNPATKVSMLYSSGIDQMRAGDALGAARSFEEVLTYDDTHIASMINLARAYLDLGQNENAGGMIDKAISIDSTNAKAYMVRGRVMQSTGDSEGAMTAYRRSIQLDEYNPFAYNNLALIYIQDGTYDEAIPLLEKSIGQKEDIVFFHNNLGIAYEGIGDLAKAEEAFEQALAIDPDYAKASINLERVQGMKVERGTDSSALINSDDETERKIKAQTGDKQEITRNR